MPDPNQDTPLTLQQVASTPQTAPSPLVPSQVAPPLDPNTNPDVPLRAPSDVDTSAPDNLPEPKLSFGEQMAREADKLSYGAPTNPDGTAVPGTFSRLLVGAAMRTLGGASKIAEGVGASLGDAAGIKPPPGGGALYGINQTMANRNARLAAQKQQGIDNARADAELQLKKDEAAGLTQERQATIAHMNAEDHRTALLARNLNEDYKEKLRASAETMAAPYLDAGSQTLGHNMSAEQIAEGINAKKIDPSRMISIVDGSEPVLDKNGNQTFDANGVPQTKDTRTILTVPPTVSVTPEVAAHVKKVLGYEPSIGNMDGLTYAQMQKQVSQKEHTDAVYDASQAEIREHLSAADRNEAETRAANLTVSEKKQNDQTKKDFAPYMVRYNNDPVVAAQQLAQSPDPKAQKLLGAVEALYGPGTLEKVRQDTIGNLNTTIKENQNRLSQIVKDNGGLDPAFTITANTAELNSGKNATTGKPLTANEKKSLQDQIDDAQKSVDEQTGLQDEVKQAQAKRSEYLGLHRTDPPQVADSVMMLDKLPASQRANTITGSATMPNAAKVYLLNHYGLPIPPALQPQQPAPAQR